MGLRALTVLGVLLASGCMVEDVSEATLDSDAGASGAEAYASSTAPPHFTYFNQATSWRMGKPFYVPVSELPTLQTSTDYLECATGGKVGDASYPGCQGGDWSSHTSQWFLLTPKFMELAAVRTEFAKLYQAAEQASPGRSIVVDVRNVFYDCDSAGVCSFASHTYWARWQNLAAVLNHYRIASFFIDEPFWTFCQSRSFSSQCVSQQISHLNAIIATTRAGFPVSGFMIDTNPSAVSCLDKLDRSMSTLTTGCNDSHSCVMLGLNAQDKVNGFDDIGVFAVPGAPSCAAQDSTGLGFDDWFDVAKARFGIHHPARLAVFSMGTLHQAAIDFCAGKPWPCVGNENALKHYAVRQLDYAENSALCAVYPWEWDNASQDASVHIADSAWHVRPLYECWGEYIAGNDECWTTSPGYEHWYPDP